MPAFLPILSLSSFDEACVLVGVGRELWYSEIVDGKSTVVITVVSKGFSSVELGGGRDIDVTESTIDFTGAEEGAADGSLGVGFGPEFGVLDGLARVNVVTVIHGLSSVPEGGGARAWRCLRTGNEVNDDWPKLYGIVCGSKTCVVVVGARSELAGIYMSEV